MAPGELYRENSRGGILERHFVVARQINIAPGVVPAEK
jgi:hypothetical protein